MYTCWWNSPDTCDLKTVLKYYNGPNLGYLWSELDENNFLLPKVNTDYIYVQHNINLWRYLTIPSMYTNINIIAQY